MSAVSLQRPLLHHLHLPSHLQLAVSPFCRPARCLGGAGAGAGGRGAGGRGNSSSVGARARLSRRSLFWGNNTAGLASSRRNRPEKSFLGRGGDLHLPCVCRSEVGYQTVARRGLKKAPLVVVEEEKVAVMEEKLSAKKRPSLLPKQLALRNSGVHGSTFISYVQILGTGMDTRDTSPSVLLFFDKRRIIFNAGEGLQRFCIEHKIKLSKLDHVFLTRVCSETASGLPGLLLTLSNTGDTGMAVNLWGPSDLNFLVDAMRTFIPGSSVVHTHSFGEGQQESLTGSSRIGGSNVAPGEALMLLEDEVVKISAVLLRPDSADPSTTGLTERQMDQAPEKDESAGSLFQSKYLQNSGANSSRAGSQDLSFSFAEPWELGFENETTSDMHGMQKRPRVESPLVTKVSSVDEGFKLEAKSLPERGLETGNTVAGSHGPLEIAVVYVCELPEIIGKFDPEKAKAIGLRPGPKYGQLQAGKSVLADDGVKTVLPSDVMDPSSPGPICLVVDCPTVSHIPSLTSAPGLKNFSPKTCNGADRASLKKVTCIIHIGPACVIKDPKYQEWMSRFEGTEHVMAGHGMLGKVSPVLKASARVMSRLNFICPQVFPIVGLQQIEDEMDTCQDDSTSKVSITTAENLLKFRLRPISATPLDRSLVPIPLDISAVQADLIAENPELQEASQKLLKLWKAKPRRVVRRKGSSDSSPEKMLGKEPELAPSDPMRQQVDNAVSSGSEGEGMEQRRLPQGSDPGLVEELPGCLKGVGRQEMEMVFLGTGSSQPSKYRNVSAIYIHLFKRGGLLLDCGEGTYAQLKRRYGNKAADDIVAGLKCVWISHIHADHHTGLARILSVRKKILEDQGRLEPVLVVGPKQLKRYLDAYGRLEDLGMEFLDCSQTTLYAESAASLIANSEDPATGSSPGNGKLGKVDKVGSPDKTGNILKAPGGLISLPSLGKSSHGDGHCSRGQLRNYWLQSGFNFQAGLDEQGREKLKAALSLLGLSQLQSVPVVHCPHAFGVVLVARGKKLLQPGWKLVYSGDTRPCQALVEASKGATVLIHEVFFTPDFAELVDNVLQATFDDAMPEEAIAKNHSLTREAIETGISAGAYRTILTHFSQRYPKIPVFNESYNDRTCIAFDMMSANLADLPLLPKLLPALKLLFKNDMLIVDEGGDELVEQP